MRESLGDGYSETLRGVYSDVPETVDFVMYWWHKASELLRKPNLKRFGLITTNSISQVWQRKAIDNQLNQKKPIRLFFAIPDHPWTDDGASVRIAMTGAEILDSLNKRIATLGVVSDENFAETPEDEAEQLYVSWKIASEIFSNLRTGANLQSSIKLRCNEQLAGRGVCLHGSGFLVGETEMDLWGHKYLESVVRLYCNGRDIVSKSRQLYVIDFFGLTEEQASRYTDPFQKILDEVKPERDVNRATAHVS